MSSFDKFINPQFKDRESRNYFVCQHLLIDPALKKILNLGGGGQRHLQKHLTQKSCEVFEVDIVGDCDLKVNLDSLDELPFKDEAFEVCCAFDVLEHLEQFHLIVQEMVRVASKQILISLPVSSAEVIRNLVLGRKLDRNRFEHGVFSKFYGLPLGVPTDRHRWWLYYEDIVRFFDYFEQSHHNCNVTYITPKPSDWKTRILRTILPSRVFHNCFTNYVFISITKNNK
jgi:SAM-dependent methyltransferase